MKQLLLACTLPAFVFAQKDGDKTAVYEGILNSKEQMMASVTLGISPQSFVEKDYRSGDWKNIQYNSQWFGFSYGFGDFRRTDSVTGRVDTVPMREWTVGANFPLKKLAVGKRLYDIRGALMIPIVGAGVGLRAVNAQTAFIGKLSTGISLQFPYIGIDFKLHTAFDFKKHIVGLKTFSLTPEIGIKIDGLYNLLDASRVYIGHAEGTFTNTYSTYSSTTERSGDYLITTTYRTDVTTVTPYSIDRNATIVGSFAAIGPHFSFQNHPYAGPTRMAGIGYYLRLGILSSDFLFDAGKIGFASKSEATHTLADPSPKSLAGVDKKDFSNMGYYNASRFQVRMGIDLYELYMMRFGEEVVIGRNQAKFTRIIGGIGYGYAMVSEPHYLRSDGRQTADVVFENDYTLLSTSVNHAKFGRDGNYLAFFCSLEAGAIRLTFESNKYFNASLANVKSISVGYLFPYNRIKKKMKAIKSYKEYIRQHG